MTALFQAVIEETSFLEDVPHFNTADQHNVSVHVGACITIALYDAPITLPHYEIVETRKLLTAAAWARIEANEAANDKADREFADKSCYDDARRARILAGLTLNVLA